jgi:hypothetical protein
VQSPQDLATLAAYPVYSLLFDGDVGAGPVRILFSSKPEDVEKILKVHE